MPRLLGQRESSLETRGAIVGMAASGMSATQIAQFVDLSVIQIRRWIRRSQQNLEDRPLASRHPGRRQVTTDEQNRAIVNAVDATPFTTSIRIREQLNVHCSVSIIKRRLRANNLFSRKPAKEIILSPAHAEARLAFCRANLERDWSNVIFTDEKVFSSSQDAPTTLWRRPLTRYNVEHVVPNKRSGRITAGFWGWMSTAGPGEIVRVTPPNFRAENYIDILENVMLPSVRILYPEDEMPEIVLVQDNCSIHTARAVRNWFQDHPEIRVLNWPSKSPDLNPIENLWGQICKNWEQRVLPRTQENLQENVMWVWEKMRRANYSQTMVDGMRRRLLECIEANGYYTRF